MSGLRIVDLRPDDQEMIRQVTQLLFEAFAHIPDWLPTLDRAREEVHESFAPGRISRVALDDNGAAIGTSAAVNGAAVGWVGGIPDYEGNVYELHPLAVK